jgi:hypothetical protein
MGKKLLFWYFFDAIDKIWGDLQRENGKNKRDEYPTKD